MASRLPAANTPLNRALKASRPAIVTAIVFSLFINVLALVSPMYMLQIYNRVLASRSVPTLIFITLIVIFLFVVYATLEALRTQVLVRGGIRFDSEIRGPTFEGVLDSTLSRRGGDSQAFRDMDSVREFMTGAGLISFCDAPWIPVFLIVAFMLHPFFGILAVLSGLLILGLAVTNEVATRDSLKRANIAAIGAQSDATATMRNSEVMRAMGMWDGLQVRWQKRRDEHIGWQASASDRGGAIMATVRFSRQVVQVLILGGGAYLAIKGQITPGSMIAASILVGRALAPIEAVVAHWRSFVTARDSWERLQGMFRGAAITTDRMPLPALKGRLTVEAASIVPPGAQNPTVQRASFVLEAGSTLCIIGPSAAGKSSLVRGLVGVWPVATGAIRLDGFDLKHWDPRELGPSVGYLPQDVELFSGTVAQNIARFAEFRSEDLIEAAKVAGVHEMIQAMPNGYETQIGDGGAALSGGQRQRVALARTIYRTPPLVVLDEPNANLDSAGEQALVQAIAHLKAAKCTIVFVTHKTNFLSLADKILLMQSGMVTQFGDRDDVLKQLAGGARPNPTSAPVTVS
jgi:PrtD family type I secretion system ABC transporter